MTEIDRQLHDALIGRNEEQAEELLNAGASPTAGEPKYGHLPLHWAAQNGLQAATRRLMQMGADVNARNFNGHSALHYAAAEEHVEIVKELLEHGADPNARDGRGFTPLGCASAHWNTESVRLLLEAGGDPNTKSEYLGVYPLHEAGSGEIVNLLSQHGADVNATDDEGRTPLDWALADDRWEVIPALRRHGASQ